MTKEVLQESPINFQYFSVVSASAATYVAFVLSLFVPFDALGGLCFGSVTLSWFISWYIHIFLQQQKQELLGGLDRNITFNS